LQHLSNTVIGYGSSSSLFSVIYTISLFVANCIHFYSVPSQYLADIEEHLGVTIQQVDENMDIPSDEFDGKVVYGQKRKDLGMLIYFSVM
jgi:hypothetical protein